MVNEAKRSGSTDTRVCVDWKKHCTVIPVIPSQSHPRMRYRYSMFFSSIMSSAKKTKHLKRFFFF